MGRGCVFQINVSNGGVPKRPLPEVTVNDLGITVDFQQDTKHHGGPEQALCLYSLELIQALQVEGHPIYPGAIGENITIAGLDWDQVVPGRRMWLGETLVQVTNYATPCRTIRHAFTNGQYGRVSETRQPGWARAYVRVLQPGKIRVGDIIRVESP